MYIQFYPTLRCNRSCDFCFNKGVPLQEDMPLAKFRGMLGKLAAAGVGTIDIMGGEPTLHTDIESMISAAESAGCSVNISSNGADPDVLGRIIRKAKRTTVGISINDQGTFDALFAFARSHRPVVKSIFSTSLDPSFLDGILALDPKKYYFLFRDAMAGEGLKDTVPFDLFYRTVTQKFDPSKVGMVYCSGFLPDTANHSELAKVRCPAGTTKLAILPDGSVYPCNLFFGIQRFRLGNILTDPFQKIWKSETLSFFRTFTGNACPRIDCGLHALCHGGCPAHSLVHFGDLAAPDPRCVGRREI